MKSDFSSRGEYKDDDITCVETECGEFKVRSSTSNNQFHTLKFKDPSCTCELWQKTHFPCKHFYAVFHTYDDWPFDKLPLWYRNSPFLTLDVETELLPTDSFTHEVDRTYTLPIPEDAHLVQEQVDADHGETSNIASKESPSSSGLRIKLRQNLQALVDLTYTVEDVSALDLALAKINEIITDLRKPCRQGGLAVRQSPVKKKIKITSTDYHRIANKPLPLRKKYKRRAVGSDASNPDTKRIDLQIESQE